MGRDEEARRGLAALAASGSVPPAPSKKPRYPGVAVRLTGTDGQAMAVVSIVRRGLAAAEWNGEIDHGASQKWISAAGGCRSYDALLRLAMEWVNVE